jgi:hypothetical protein
MQVVNIPEVEIIDTAPSTIQEVQKSQFVRGIDILFIAPFLFYVSRKKGITKTDRYIILIIAVATLVYNLHNYLKNKN